MAQVRRWIAATLTDLGPAHLTDVVQVADELVSNAYEHAGGPCAIHLHHQRAPCLIVIEVEDSHPESPTLGRSRFGTAAHRGRGLVYVNAVARAWGMRTTDHDRGMKTVWAQVTCNDEARVD